MLVNVSEPLKDRSTMIAPKISSILGCMPTDQSLNHSEFIKAVVPCICVCVLSHARLFVTLWTVAYQAPLSMGFSRQEYWIGLPFPSPTLWEGYLIGYYLMGDYPSDPFSCTMQSLFPYWAVSGKSWEVLEKTPGHFFLALEYITKYM